jgi:hypothetical protein
MQLDFLGVLRVLRGEDSFHANAVPARRLGMLCAFSVTSVSKAAVELG